MQYSNPLNAGLIWYPNGRLVPGCQIVRYSNGGLKTGLKSLFMVQNVRYLNGPPSHLNTRHSLYTKRLYFYWKKARKSRVDSLLLSHWKYRGNRACLPKTEKTKQEHFASPTILTTMRFEPRSTKTKRLQSRRSKRYSMAPLQHLNTRHPYCLVFRCIQYSGVRCSSDGYCIKH